MPSELRRMCIAVALTCFNATGALAIVLSDREQNHVVTPGQASYGINLDGVALLGTDSRNSSTIEDVLVPRCTGALITDRHLLSAAHCFDEDKNGEIDFLYRSFPVVAAFELPDRDVLIRVNTDSIHMPPGWPDWADIAVLELAESPPPEIPRYPLYGSFDEVGQSLVLAGYGDTGFGDTGIDDVESEQSIKRAGLNRYDDIRDDYFPAFDFDSGLEQNNAMAALGFESDLGFGPNEVFIGEGDSGGPTFINGLLAGVHNSGARLPAADIDNVPNSSWGEVGFDIRVSSFQDFILTATNNEAVFLIGDSGVYDFDANGELNMDDIDALVRQIIAVRRGDAADLAFDVTGDGDIDTSDRDRWLSEAAAANGFVESYSLGDSNLDGSIDAQDLNAMGKNWLGHPDTWTSGDFNADGTVDAGDLNKLGQNWLVSNPLAASPENIPESSAISALYVGVFLVALMRLLRNGSESGRAAHRRAAARGSRWGASCEYTANRSGVWSASISTTSCRPVPIRRTSSKKLVAVPIGLAADHQDERVSFG